MSHWQIRFRVSGDEADAVGDALTGLGALSVTMENAGADEFYEAAYPQRPEWPEVEVTGLFERAVDPERVASDIRSDFACCARHRIDVLEDRDWERSWLADYRPLKAGRDLWVVPSWIGPPDPGAVNIVLDPGLAFGTGTHPTTALCLSWLDGNRPIGGEVIDYGCGSGILAIAALKLGASRAWGIDIDPRALTASRENAARNQVSDRYSACAPGDLPENFVADLVMANILARTLIDLRNELQSLVRSDGVILLTGILTEQVADVTKQFDTWFDFSEERREEWSLLVGVRR